MLSLSERQDQDCANVDRITIERLAEVDGKIADAQKLAKELRRLSGCCQGGGRMAGCRIIEALSS